MEMLLSLVILSTILYNCLSHPQCLDSQAPFKPNAGHMLCKQYSHLGCCTEKDDNDIQTLYEDSLKTVRNRSQCERHLSRVICLKCHPWSAHIFDAESNPNFDARSALPQLGRGLCKRLVNNCAQAVVHIWGDAMKARNITLDDFCPDSNLSSDYRFPRINKMIRQLKNSNPKNIAAGASASKRGCLCVREVVKSLRNPLALVHANDQTHRKFIVEQIGLVYIILHNGTKLLTPPFMDIRSKILTSSAFGDERGLLGLAFHPKYRENGRLFVYYITKKKKKGSKRWWLAGGVAVLSEWRVSATDLNRVDPYSEKEIMLIEQPKGNHNGGELLFGEDEYLYVFPGDGGGAGDRFGKYGNALNKSTLLGKVLRIDVNNTTKKTYNIPPDNPFLKEPQTRPEIFAYGVRNPWRCSVDRGDRESGDGRGRIFCGDVGQNKYEEIDIIVKGGNYGWRGREGFRCYDKKICNSSLMANEILPIHAYSHNVGQSIVGGYVYRGCNYPKLRGSYFFADTMNGRMFTLKEDLKSGKWLSKEVCMGDSSYCTGPGISGEYASMILSFGEDESGELYFLSTEFTDNEARKGAVYQIIDPERRTDPSECTFTAKKPVKPACHNRMSSKACVVYKNLGYCKRRFVRAMSLYCKATCGWCQ